MQINNKAVNMKFKIYSFYLKNYFYNFLFAFQVVKISRLKKNFD